MFKPDIIGSYDFYLKEKAKSNDNIRKKQKEDRYSSSAAGMCTKQQWYKKFKPNLEQPFSDEMMRTFEVGNLLDKSFDAGVSLIYRTNKYSQDYIKDDDLNIGGSFDLLLVDESGNAFLYDYKTTNSYTFNHVYGKPKTINGNQSGDHNKFQLGTYALILENKYKEKYNFKKIQYMALIGFEKNFSAMKELEVDLKYIEFAERYWKEAHPIIKSPIEPLPSTTVPYEDWNCKYCSFNLSCQNPTNPKYKGKTK